MCHSKDAINHIGTFIILLINNTKLYKLSNLNKKLYYICPIANRK